MNRQSIVWMLLVASGTFWSGCELNSETSKTLYTTPVATTEATATTEAVTTNAATTADVAQWPSYFAPDFFQHGNSGEEAYRSAAVSAARAQGLSCLYIECSSPPNDEVAMHLMHFESPVRPGYFLGDENWYNKAAAQGISRYIFDIGNADSSTIARWKYLTKAYPGGSVQWVLNGHTLAALP